MKFSQILLGNEEDLKNKIVLPYLCRLGVSAENLEFENSFQIRLGRAVIQIGDKTKHVEDYLKTGKADILCKHNGKPFFIIETEHPSNKLTSEKRDQGISYARLLDQVAPYVIVTNGCDTKIYDTLTKADLSETDLKDSSWVKNGYRVTIEEDLIFEAQRCLIGLDAHNLQIFSLEQRKSRMSPLKGDEKNTNKKYIPAIYADRSDLDKRFNEFLQSDKACFLLTGESGVGKTNFMCHSSENLPLGFVGLFYSGKFLGDKKIEHAIAEDFNWEFSAQRNFIDIVKRVESILTQHKGTIVIFVDGIDEWLITDPAESLHEFIDRIKDRRIKIFVSCKSHEIERFINIKGDPTSLRDNLFITSSNTSYSFQLPLFNDKELQNAIDKYQDFFGFRDPIFGKTREEARNGFILRILFDVYSTLQQTIPEDISSADIVTKYIEKKLEVTEDRDISKRILKKTAELMLTESRFEILEEELYDKLAIPISQKIDDALFSYNTLVKNRSEELTYVSFYFDKVRDYVISYWILKLQTLDESSFGKKLQEFYSNRVAYQAINFYIRNGSASHKLKFLNHHRGNEYDFLYWICELDYIENLQAKITTILESDSQKKYFLLDQLSRKKILSLKRYDFIWSKVINERRLFELIKAFENNLTEHNCPYIIEFWESNFSKLQDSMYFIEVGKMFKSITEEFPSFTEQINKVSQKVLKAVKNGRPEIHDFYDVKDLSLIIKNSMVDYLRSNEYNKAEETIDFVFDTYEVVTDNSEFFFYTPPEMYEMIKIYLIVDVKSHFFKVRDYCVKKFDQLCGGKFDGYEWSGGGVNQSGGRFFINDLVIVTYVFTPALRDYYQRDKRKNWIFLKDEILKLQWSKKNPIFLKRAIIDILLERLKDKSSKVRSEALTWLKEFVTLNKGFPAIYDIIFCKISESTNDYPGYLVLELVKTDIQNGILPSSTFVVIILFDLIQNNVKGAQKLFLGLLEQEDYIKVDKHQSHTCIHLQKIVKTKPSFVEKVIRKLLFKSNWLEFQDHHDTWELQDVLKDLVIIDWQSTRIKRNRGLGIIKQLLKKEKLLDNEQRLISRPLPEMVKIKPLETFDFIWTYIKDIDDLPNYFTYEHSREDLAVLSEILIENGCGVQGIKLIDKLINDPNPETSETDHTFNDHLKIKRGEDVSTIGTVRGRVAWALQHLAVRKEYLSHALERVECLAGDSNLYVRRMTIFPFVEIVRRRSWFQEIDPSLENRVKTLSFRMLRNNRDYKRILNELLHVFSHFRDLDESEAKIVLKEFEGVPDASFLFIYFAIYRKEQYEERGPFDSKEFEDILTSHIKDPSSEIRANIALQFWRHIDKSFDYYGKYKRFIFQFFEGIYDLKTFQNLLLIIERILSRGDLFDEGYELFHKHLNLEKDYVLSSTGPIQNWRSHPLEKIFVHIFTTNRLKYLDSLERLLTYALSGKIVIPDLYKIVKQLSEFRDPKDIGRVEKIFDRLILFNGFYYKMKRDWLDNLR